MKILIRVMITIELFLKALETLRYLVLMMNSATYFVRPGADGKPAEEVAASAGRRVAPSRPSELVQKIRRFI